MSIWIRSTVIVLWSCFAGWTRAAEGLDFDRSVAALLVQRCLDCHNATEKKGGLDLSRQASAMAGGDSGPVIMRGKPEESLLWERISADEMPPKKPLAEDERQLLRRWIEQGAAWGSDPIDPFRFTTESRAGRDWWSLQPIAPAKIPETQAAELANPIDAFIAAKRHEKGLRSSPEADRATLIRRLSFDLLGLPPTPADVAAFVSDPAPMAYEQLVERLLMSPAYGERWGRHWLDVARFGESQGFERDKLRTNSWRYRDWVIDAFNADLAYDEFVRRQLAGDVLYPDDPTAAVPTGFLVAGPFDEVGQSQQSAAMKLVVRQDELEDIVSVVGQTFLGLTVNCARCHDHKFDPVSQREYYRLSAALSGVRHGQRMAQSTESQAAAQWAAAGLAGRIAALEQQVARLEAPVRERLLAERKARAESTQAPAPLARWDFDEDLRDRAGELHALAQETARVEDGQLLVDGKSFAMTYPLKAELKEKTLEAWVTLADLQQRGGAVIGVQALDGSLFDAIVYGERDPRQWMAGSNGFERTQSFAGPEETEADAVVVHVAIVYEANGTITGYRNGQVYGTPYKSPGLQTFKPGQSQVVFGLRHHPPGGNRLLKGGIERAQLYDRALSSEEIAASAGTVTMHVSERELTAALSDSERASRNAWRFELEQLRSQQSRLADSTIYAVTPKQPEVTHVLLRGNPAQPEEQVTPGGIAAVTGLEADFGLTSDAPEDVARTKLAHWIADAQNPLVARVLVNRLWHYHFGVGLVDTPNDFGFNGSRPTHPELIDWLANELIRQDWSIKSLQRLIVTSAAYRQSSRYDADQARIDADNRYLWRKSPQRLEAEVLRDAMLAVSGELNARLHGPGYHDFRTFIFNSQFYEMLDPDGPTFQRRSIYRTWVRSGRNQFLDVFDCPDPSAKAPARAVTTTPLQALSLWNNSFALRMSERMSERARREAGESTADQVRHVYALAFCRQPDAAEVSLAQEFVEQHGLAALCRVIFNGNEFLYID